MGHEVLNSLILKQVGARLLPDERLEVAVELEGGLTEELEQHHATLLLTNKRLMRYSAGEHNINVISALLDDVDSVEVRRSEKNSQWVWVGLVFIAGGVLLGLLSALIIPSPLSPMLMAVALTLIGIVFLLTYVGGLKGDVTIRAGNKAIKSRMHPRALDDMSVFVQRLYELKLGHQGQANRSDAVTDGTYDNNGANQLVSNEPVSTSKNQLT